MKTRQNLTEKFGGKRNCLNDIWWATLNSRVYIRNASEKSDLHDIYNNVEKTRSKSILLKVWGVIFFKLIKLIGIPSQFVIIDGM